MKGFVDRHIGTSSAEVSEMLQLLDVNDVDALIEKTVPASIRLEQPMVIGDAVSEHTYLKQIQQIAKKNKPFRSFIGQGYYGTIVPSPILRNIFQNPGWYTQYTPYQAEISQGRLEALLNFQTVVSDLTGLPIANASLLDEATACAEAMSMFYGVRNKRGKDKVTRFFVDKEVFPQTIEVIQTRAIPLGIEVTVGDWKDFKPTQDYFGVLIQYPDAGGEIHDFTTLVDQVHAQDGFVIAAADILSLALLTPPGEWGADAVVGTTQRLGVPMGFGGPHAAYFATHDKYKRQIPGRIIGVSVDASGGKALRMALQTREQHIRREKATSNICTAQALLAIMAGMYAVYHGPEGVREIAKSIASKTCRLATSLINNGFEVLNKNYFDTIRIKMSLADAEGLREKAEALGVNFYYRSDGIIQISLDETVDHDDLQNIAAIFDISLEEAIEETGVPDTLQRSSHFLQHEVFHKYQTETNLMRYIKGLENKDLSLTHAMIPLGSCTMKLNAATQLIPVSWPEFSDIHPFAPEGQVAGYLEIIEELGRDLCTITGLAACSFQPNSGAQGEYAGLMAIRGYHQYHGNADRNVTLIPSSAHGTNPASAVMAGMDVVIVKCDEEGNIDVDDLKARTLEHSDRLAALMITYPSTHGVFEEGIKKICALIHEHGGLVYMDGANMNAQVGITNPGVIGADVCHLNLHKTFAIPHGGGGPGMGPICVNEKLAPFLAGHITTKDPSTSSGSVSAAAYGSASILLISYGYIKMLGRKGLLNSTKIAILNANYIRARLQDSYDVLYTGENGYCAHELILDLRPYKSSGIGAEDVAKRLIDYGFHAPTLSFPVPGTLMIEPTESEDKNELDRFCDAMIEIKNEIDEIARGDYAHESNVLVHAPHTIECLVSDTWTYPYTREKAAYPLPWLRHQHKFWPSVRRVDNAYGDRTLVCTCPPIEAYMDKEEA